MRLLKTFKIICIMMFALTSCSSDDEDFQGAVTPPTNRRITSYEARTSGSTTTNRNSVVDISYDSQKRISNIECPYSYGHYNVEINYEKMEIVETYWTGSGEGRRVWNFKKNSQGYITNIAVGDNQEYIYEYENGYLTKIYFDDECLEEREYTDGNLKKITPGERGEGSESYWISYSDDDNISNLDPSFIFESIPSFVGSGFAGVRNKNHPNIISSEITSATAVLSHAGLFGKNSAKLPKRVTYYSYSVASFETVEPSGIISSGTISSSKTKNLDINYELDNNGYVQSIEAINVEDDGSPSQYRTFWDFSYSKY